MPFYPITTKGSDAKRVIEADNPAAAMKHAAKGMFTVGKPMGPTDIVAHMQAAGTVEKAGEEPATASSDA